MNDLRRDVVIVRHGATVWSESRQHTGRTDIALTLVGEAEARALRTALTALAGGHDVHAFTSPLLRARMTCQLAAPEMVDVRVDDDLAEYDYGDYEGKTSAEIHRARPDWEIFRDGCPGGESPSQVTARCDRFIARIATLEGAVFVFTHGHLSRFLAARLLGLAGSDGRVLWNNTGSYAVVRTDTDRDTVLVAWNVRSR